MEQELRGALGALVEGLPARAAGAAVDRLIANYRGRTPTGAPVLRDRADVTAYAAYRMPATFGAVSAALSSFAAAAGGRPPASHTDVGGGTGAAVWAAADVWGASGGDGGPARETTVLDWAEPALALGRELAARSTDPSVRAARWQAERLAPGLTLPGADLVTVSYVLGELTAEARAAVVDAAARSGRAVVIVEPGTPDGYLRVREARDRLVGAGLRVLAPCPHSGACPLTPGADWCHFAARVNRSSLHRQVKGGSLPYEDEKYSYVAVVREDAATEPGDGAAGPGPAPARIIRRPQVRKGQVLLDLCDREGAPRRETVTKRHGAAYRAARDARWGDAWQPVGAVRTGGGEQGEERPGGGPAEGAAGGRG